MNRENQKKGKPLTPKPNVSASREIVGENLNEILFGPSPDALIAISPEDEILFWNLGAETIFAYTSSEAVGCLLRECRSVIYVDISARAAVRNDLGDIKFVALSQTDITQLMVSCRDPKILEAKFGGFLQNVPDAIVIVSHVGLIALVNSQDERLVAYYKDEFLGKPVEILLPVRHRSPHLGYRIDFFSSRPGRVQ